MLPFLLTSLAVELTPGPNMAYLVLMTSLRGRRAGFFMVPGIALGLLTVGTASALGAASLMAAFPPLYHLLKWVGVFYMLWLAYDAWVSSTQKAEDIADKNYFAQGFITNILNPKAYLFFITVLPSFIPQSEPAFSVIMPYVALYVMVASLVHLALVFLADRARGLLSNAGAQATLGRVFAALLVAIAFWLALKT